MHQFKGENLDIFDKTKPRERVAIAILFAEHEAAEAECHAFGQKVADACNCRLIKGPLKTLKRADEKVAKDYQGKGDWSLVKDLVRMTILATRSEDLPRVGKQIREMATWPWGILKDEEARAYSDPCGYSGLNFVLQKNRVGSVGLTKLGQARVSPPPDAKGISNAQWAKTVRMEIQANIPEVIYGKEAEVDFVKMLDRALFEQAKAKCKIVGGLGHVFYEISKGAVSPQTQQTAKSLSKRYYKYLRNPLGCSHEDFRILCKDLEPFVEANEAFFHKQPIHSISLIPLSTPAGVAAPKPKWGTVQTKPGYR
jgi:hypothetical protein